MKKISDVLPVLKHNPGKIDEIKRELTRQLPLGLRDKLFDNLLSSADVVIGQPKIIEGKASAASTFKMPPTITDEPAPASLGATADEEQQ